MSKPPAFQFYADDFLAGTSDMTAEEVGVYIRLLCHQWNKGGLPNDPDRLAMMAGAMAQASIGYAMAKFRLCDDGLLRNDRMERERKKQVEFRQEQAEKGRKGALSRWKNGSGHSPVMADAMPTPIPKAWPNNGSPSPSPSPIDISVLLADAPARKPSSKKEHLPEWFTVELTLAWQQWMEHLKERDSRPTNMTRKTWIMEIQRHGIPRAIEIIQFSISKGAKSLCWDQLDRPTRPTAHQKANPAFDSFLP